jgi:hypothetical protein
MQIIVNHLTRMQTGYMCVAGINISNNQHVRPVLRTRLPISLLALHGGPFDIASLIDLGQVRYCGSPPEVEDYYFNLQNLRNRGVIPPDQFWKHLQNVARRSIREIFGPAIKQVNRACVVDVRTGKASLGCLIPVAPPRLFINSYGKLRATITDGDFDLSLSVTDIRLYEADHQTPNENLIKQINNRMQDGNPVILSLGLTRPFRPDDDTAEQHWLQLNNIHLKYNTAIQSSFNGDMWM